MSNIIHSLDIGTDSIKILSCTTGQNSSHLRMLAINSLPCFGVRKGVVVDIEKVSNCIKQLTDKQVQAIGRRIDNVYVNINGHHIFVVPSHGTVAISRADQVISQEDIDRVIQAAKAISLPSNKEILGVISKDFVIDGEKGIEDPLGMKGIRLEANILAICGFSPYIKNLSEAVLNSGISGISDTIISPLAAARAVLTPQQKELGVAVLDIGASTTGLAVFDEGDLIHLAIFPIGSFNITKDIAIGFKTRIDIAEEIKRKFGLTPLQKRKTTKKKSSLQISKEDSASVNLSLKEFRKIVEPRIDEIFSFVNRELKKIGRQKQLPAGVVITGGGAKLSGIVGIAKDKLKLPVSIGFPQGITGLPKDTSLSVVAGLALLGSDLDNESPPEIGGKFINFFRKIFKVFIP